MYPIISKPNRLLTLRICGTKKHNWVYQTEGVTLHNAPKEYPKNSKDESQPTNLDGKKVPPNMVQNGSTGLNH